MGSYSHFYHTQGSLNSFQRGSRDSRGVKIQFTPIRGGYKPFQGGPTSTIGLQAIPEGVQRPFFTLQCGVLTCFRGGPSDSRGGPQSNLPLPYGVQTIQEGVQPLPQAVQAVPEGVQRSIVTYDFTVVYFLMFDNHFFVKIRGWGPDPRTPPPLDPRMLYVNSKLFLSNIPIVPSYIPRDTSSL